MGGVGVIQSWELLPGLSATAFPGAAAGDWIGRGAVGAWNPTAPGFCICEIIMWALELNGQF